MTDFMVLVERAVRPVPAAPGRKQRMRDELLAHLTGVYEDELPRLGEAAARAEAARRFGDPAALTEDLTASLAFSDRVEARVDRWFGWRPGEPPHRTALRITGLVGLLLVPWMVFGAVVGEVRHATDPTVLRAFDFLRIGVVTLGFGGGSVFLLAWLTGRLREARSRLRVAGDLAGLALVTPAMTLPGRVAFDPGVLTRAPSLPFDWNLLVAVVLSILVAPVAAVLMVRSTRAEVARRLEWARLDVG